MLLGGQIKKWNASSSGRHFGERKVLGIKRHKLAQERVIQLIRQLVLWLKNDSKLMFSLCQPCNYWRVPGWTIIYAGYLSTILFSLQYVCYVWFPVYIKFSIIVFPPQHHQLIKVLPSIYRVFFLWKLMDVLFRVNCARFNGQGAWLRIRQKKQNKKKRHIDKTW